MCGNKFKIKNSKSKYKICHLSLVIGILFVLCALCFVLCSFAQDIKEPNVAGMFYPANPQELSAMVDSFLMAANPEAIEGDIFALILPHAGYGFSGQTAAYGYKLIKGKPYKTVVVIGTSHHYGLGAVSVYPKGIFRTPLGDLEIDADFTQKLLNKSDDVIFEPKAFAKEHSVEVQLPFLQKVLSNFSATESGGPAKNYGWKIVPIIVGDCTLATCQKFASLLKEAIGDRKDVLVVASTDMYHGYDFQEDETVDNLTISYLREMDTDGLYYSLREGKSQLCGGFGVVATLILAKELGHNKLKVLNHTNSAEVTHNKTKGNWTVGYVSCAIDQAPLEPIGRQKEDMRSLTGQAKGETAMFNKSQRKRLLEIARSSIETYLKTGKKLEVTETDPLLLKEMGAFVTLGEHGQLRGCIGNLIGQGPLYLTVRDMAVEAATGDPRFSPVQSDEIKDLEIEVSVLSPMQKIDNPDVIEMGKHGVLVRKGFRSGVYLPQVATETGWSKEEFLSSLCAHKAGLAPDAWKDKGTDIYIFTAEVFSEKDY